MTNTMMNHMHLFKSRRKDKQGENLCKKRTLLEVRGRIGGESVKGISVCDYYI